MKKKNSVSDFTSERNAMLVREFHRSLASQSNATLDHVFRDVANQPSPRFWVSEHRAAVVISAMLKTDTIGQEEILNSMYEEKREMYREIFARVKVLREQNPDIPVLQAVFDVVNEPAPRNYMSWQRARTIIYKEKRRRRLERSLR